MKLPIQSRGVAKTTRDGRVMANVTPSVDWTCILKCGGSLVTSCFSSCVFGSWSDCYNCVASHAPKCLKCF